jgi:hypothetical protein
MPPMRLGRIRRVARMPPMRYSKGGEAVLQRCLSSFYFVVWHFRFDPESEKREPGFRDKPGMTKRGAWDDGSGGSGRSEVSLELQ